MNKRFCSTCNQERRVVNSVYGNNGAERLLSCGHKFTDINLSATLHVSEDIQLRKTGEINEKRRRRDKPLNVNYAKKFLEYGDTDYEAAVTLFNIQDRDYDFMNQAAFLCAQAVEKYLKAFLFWNSPQHYTNMSGKQILEEVKGLRHNLVKILDECIKDNNDFNKFRDEVKSINRYSLLKYPDIEDEMVYSDDGLSVSSEILKDVKQIADFVKALVI